MENLSDRSAADEARSHLLKLLSCDKKWLDAAEQADVDSFDMCEAASNRIALCVQLQCCFYEDLLPYVHARREAEHVVDDKMLIIQAETSILLSVGLGRSFIEVDDILTYLVVVLQEIAFAQLYPEEDALVFRRGRHEQIPSSRLIAGDQAA